MLSPPARCPWINDALHASTGLLFQLAACRQQACRVGVLLCNPDWGPLDPAVLRNGLVQEMSVYVNVAFPSFSWLPVLGFRFRGCKPVERRTGTRPAPRNQALSTPQMISAVRIKGLATLCRCYSRCQIFCEDLSTLNNLYS